jgi:LCP family protein required for cell wall assembly
MPDDQQEDRPSYDWLFTAGAGRRPEPQTDPDATQTFDPNATQTFDRNATQSEDGRDESNSDATRVIGASGSPGRSPAGSYDGNSARSWPPENPAGGRPSFGGTYTGARQPTSPEPRFAVPVQSRPARSRPARPRPAGQSTRQKGAAPQAAPPGGAQVRGASARSGSPRRSRNWWVRAVLALILVWLVFLVVVPVWAWSKVSKVNAEPAGHRPPGTAGATYLLVGSDSRAGLSKAQEGALGTGSAAGQRTDTIILLDVPANGPTLMVSIPRDSYVTIPGHGQNKINAAYSLGGPRLLVRTVEKATKVRVDNYIEVGFAGFVDVVDSVGGIQVCPKTSIVDRKAGHLHMHKGCQHIDGTTALGYSRSRAFPNGDITRALHQREVIGAVGSAAASWKTIVLPWRYFSLNSAAAKAVKVGKNVSPIAVVRFAWAMAHAGSSSTKRCVVPYSDLGASTSVGSVVLWDQHRAHKLFAAVRSGDTSTVHCAPH